MFDYNYEYDRNGSAGANNSGSAVSNSVSVPVGNAQPYGAPSYQAPAYAQEEPTATSIAAGIDGKHGGSANGKGGSVVEAAVTAQPVKVESGTTPAYTGAAAVNMDSDLMPAQDITYQAPEGSTGFWVGMGLATVIWFGVVVFVLVFVTVVKLEFSAPIKAVCTSASEMDNNLCILAIGQSAWGIISIGQFGFGLFNFSQIGMGVFTAIGQVQASAGFSTAQITVSSYVGACQLGLGMMRVHLAQLGIQVGWVWRRVRGEQDSMFVSCHKNGCGTRRRRRRNRL